MLIIRGMDLHLLSELKRGFVGLDGVVPSCWQVIELDDLRVRRESLDAGVDVEELIVHLCDALPATEGNASTVNLLEQGTAARHERDAVEDAEQ